MNDRAKPKIHFILPGGGVRGAFQADFYIDCLTSTRIVELVKQMEHLLVHLMQ